MFPLLPAFIRLAVSVLPLLCAGLPAFASTGITVVTSIKPLALIAQEVVGENANVETLLPINASPHDYPMRVSDVRRLQRANLVLWVGPSLEAFLQRPLNNIPATKRLAAFDLTGMYWPEDDSHQHSHGDHHHHGHDPHLWLDPRNAAVIAHALANKMAEIDPAAGNIYHQNAKKFAAAALALDQRLLLLLKPVREKGFAVYHEGYLHFVERYGLQQLAYVTYTPERRPGAKHLYELRQRLKGNASCLFIEPYYDMRVAADLAQELNLRVATLDPIGEDQVTSYEQLLEQMAQAFLTCLADRSAAGES